MDSMDTSLSFFCYNTVLACIGNKDTSILSFALFLSILKSPLHVVKTFLVPSCSAQCRKAKSPSCTSYDVTLEVDSRPVIK